MKTLEHRLSAGRAGNGYNRIRLIAALLVLFSHAFPITGAVEPLERLGLDTSLGLLSVAAFFVISGVLISASYERSQLARFVEKRVMRIMPALAVSVLLCVFLLGPLLTRSPDYFSQGQTWAYLGRAVFFPTAHELPGLFADHPNTAVNGSLWSLLYEVICYVGVAMALCFRAKKLLVIGAWLMSFALARAIPEDAGGGLYYVRTLAELFRFFGAGMLLYLYRDRIPIRADIGLGAALLVLAGAFTPVFEEVCAVAGSYAVIALAYLWKPLQSSSETDFSYGVYIYAFPVQQAVYQLVGGNWAVNILVALPITLGLAALSWYLVERPAMRLNWKAKAPALSPGH